MRSLLLVLVLAAGCGAPRLLPARVPAPDPYAVASAREEFPAAVKIYAPRHLEWSDARHAREVAAVASSVQVRVLWGSDLAVLTGPEAAAEAAAGYLCDRVRFAGFWRVLLDVHEVRVPADAWSFESLIPEPGEAWTVVPNEHARRLLAEPSRSQLASYDAPDAEEVEHGLTLQSAYLAGLIPVRGETGVVVRDPHLLTLETGTTLRSTAWLVGDGRTVVLDFHHETTRQEAQPTVLATDAPGFTAMPVSLPRVVKEEAGGRFVLRDDEALVFVRAAPASDDELILTLVGWARVWRGP